MPWTHTVLQMIQRYIYFLCFSNHLYIIQQFIIVEHMLFKRETRNVFLKKILEKHKYAEALALNLSSKGHVTFSVFLWTYSFFLFLIVEEWCLFIFAEYLHLVLPEADFWLHWDIPLLFCNDIQEILKSKVTKPYSPIVAGPSVDLIQKEALYAWTPQQMPGSVSRSSFESSSRFSWFTKEFSIIKIKPQSMAITNSGI